jgi:hypothetical protein
MSAEEVNWLLDFNQGLGSHLVLTMPSTSPLISGVNSRDTLFSDLCLGGVYVGGLGSLMLDFFLLGKFMLGFCRA